MKRIALIGNMNNNFFSITRYLRDQGYDAHLFYTYPVEHFQPKADTFLLDYLHYCHEVSWSNNFTNSNAQEIIRILTGFQFFIGQGNEAAIAAFAGIKFDIYFPYGSDIYKYAWLPHYFSLKQMIYMKIIKGIPIAVTRKGTMSKYIHKAIVEAKNVYMDYTNEEYERKLTRLDLQGKFEHIPMPFIYYPQYENRRTWDVHWKNLVDRLRSKNDLIILYHGRQEWKISKQYKNNDFTTKNTHHLIIAYSQFLKSFPTAKSKLVMIEYGGDIDHSKVLINDLGIAPFVEWLPKMYRKDLMYLIDNCDICTGEFYRSYLTFGTIIEAMLMGKPVIHYREDSLYLDKYPELYPLYNAREIGEIAAQLQSAWQNPTERTRIGESARRWVIKYFIKNPLEKILLRIEES